MRPGLDSGPVGILGGTFDPVHLGHLHVATEVRREFSLRQVRLVPCAVPPHKPGARLAPAEHRVAMLRLAIAGRTGLAVDTAEIDRGGVSYTVDTLQSLASRDAITPVFILGLDALLELHTWMRYRELMDEFDLIVVDRPEHGPEHVRERLDDEIAARLTRTRHAVDLGRGGRIFHLGLPPLAIASSDIRRRSSRGTSLEGLVPLAVDRYIQEHRLYQEDSR